VTAALRAQPFEAEHRSSVASLMAPPRTPAQLLAWFLREWSLEVPDALHVPGVWRDHVRLDEDRASVGGSLMGSPALHGGFRSYLENSPRQLDADGRFLRPVHAALAEMAGRRSPSSVFMAAFLYRLACSGGDAEAVGRQWEFQPGVAEVYAAEALRRLWRSYSTAA
jgi:hypothetical protein